MGTGPSSLRLNQRRARWLGVCAGIADWLDVPVTLVRVVFVICVLSWPTLIIGYFILYFCLDKDITPEKMRNYFANASTAEHFRELDYRKPIYKNERNKKIAGVCSGIADYFEVSPFAVRAVTLISLFIFGPFTFWAYIICIFAFDPDPHMTPENRMKMRSNKHQHKAKWKQKRAERRARRKNRKSYRNEEYKEFTDEVEAAVEEVGEAVATAFGEMASNMADKETAHKNADPDNYMDTEAEMESTPKYNPKACTDVYNTLELRLREIEAYMTSKKFRLHCEINRI